MRLATFVYEGKEEVGAVTAKGGAAQVVPIRQLGAFPTTMLGLIQAGPETWRKLAAALEEEVVGLLSVDEVTLRAPIPRTPKNVICLGLNYAAHAAEQGTALPEHLVVFTKAPTTINAPYGEIPFDAGVSEAIDWEVELGVVIGRSGRQIAPEQALEYVFGYTAINDISARDIQKRHKQYFLGKSLDGSCPMGPWIVTADEIADPQALGLRTRVNGVLKQDGSSADQVFGVAQAIAIVSRGMTLEPGDVIATGTPAGVGFARTPPEYLRPGDVVECEVEGIGTIRNRVVARKDER